MPNTAGKKTLQETTEAFMNKRDKLLATLWEMNVQEWAEAVQLLTSTLNAISLPYDFIVTTTIHHVRARPSTGDKN